MFGFPQTQESHLFYYFQLTPLHWNRSLFAGKAVYFMEFYYYSHKQSGLILKDSLQMYSIALVKTELARPV